VLKAQLLKRFKLAVGGYWKKFKSSILEVVETPKQFIERLRRYLSKWHKKASFEEIYEGL